MDQFKKKFLKKDKKKRKSILARMLAYRDRYLPIKLYGNTKEFKDITDLIEAAKELSNK